MRRALWAWCLSGCATVAPMQTASTVEDGHWRVGAQLGAAGYCGSFTEGPLECTEYPDGVPLPELRVDARRGLPHGADVGMSLQVLGQVLAPSRPIQGGLTLEAKHELVEGSVAGRRQVLSLGLLLGGAISGRPGLRAYGQVEGGVELLYGLQTKRFEVVLGAAYSERTLFDTPEGRTQRVGFTLGLFRRNPAGWALQVGYLGNTRRFSDGSIQLQYGVFWDR